MQTFSLQNQKTTYSTTLKTFFTVIQISPYLKEAPLNRLYLYANSLHANEHLSPITLQ